VAVVILHVHKYEEEKKVENLNPEGCMRGMY